MAKIINILVDNNNKYKLEGDIKVLMKLKKEFAINHPNAFYVRRQGNVSKNWDGKIHHITEANYFKSGLLPKVVEKLKSFNCRVNIIDNRRDINIKPTVPKLVGNLKPRKYQHKAIRSIIRNEINGMYFPIGVLDMATNAGKTLMMAMLFLAYHRKMKMVVLIDDGDLYNQFLREIPELIGHDDFGYVRGKEQKWGNFTICMIQTLARDIKYYSKHLSQCGIVAVDEADKSANKSYRTILQNCHNAQVRVGLSGSIYIDKLKKHQPKNWELESFYGKVTYKVTKKDMVDMGHSTRIIANIVEGSTKPKDMDEKDWKAEYDRNITYNEDRALKCIERVKYHSKFGRIPALIVCQFHEHINMMNIIFQKELGKRFKIKAVHGDTKDRKEILEDFRVGKIDILIASFIVKRGKNFPLIRYIQNAAGSDSQSTIWQIMGRGERKDDSKKKVYMDDFMDSGKYLSRHSKHRIQYYKNTGFEVRELYKDTINNK